MTVLMAGERTALNFLQRMCGVATLSRTFARKAAGRTVIVDVDVQGAQELMKCYPGALFVFVLPPSMDVLQRRLEGRKTEDPEEQARRLREAARELGCRDRYTCEIVNDDLDRAAGELRRRIGAHPPMPGPGGKPS